jgi:cytochrome P450
MTTGGCAGALLGGVAGLAGFNYKKEIKDAAKKAEQTAKDTKDLAIYMTDISAWKIFGESFYRFRYQQRDGSHCPFVRAFGGNTFVTAQDVHLRLSDLEDAAQRGDIVRHNWLGPAKLANQLMVDGVFGLGAPYEDHKMAREWLDSSLWGAAKKWDEEQVRAFAKSFVDEHPVLQMPKSIKVYTVAFLGKHWLGLRDNEFDANVFVKDYQSNRYLFTLFPDWMLSFPVVRRVRDWIQRMQENYVQLITESIQRTYPKEVEGKNVRVIAATALDALCFAGGLSVGETISRVIAGISNKTGDLGKENFKVTRDNISEVIFETMRLFPAVSNVAYERLRPFGKGAGAEVTGREVLAIGPVMRDPKAWGDDAEEFHLREPNVYKTPAFCPFANGATKRDCPGADLALALIRSMVLEINSRPWQVQRKWIHTLPVPSPVPIPGGLGRTKVWFWGYSNEDFAVEFL